MPTDAEVSAALAAVPHANIRSADMLAALEAAEEVRVAEIRASNLREFEEFASTSSFPEIRALGEEQDSEPVRDTRLWSAAKRYYAARTRDIEAAPAWHELSVEQRNSLRWLASVAEAAGVS